MAEDERCFFLGLVEGSSNVHVCISWVREMRDARIASPDFYIKIKYNVNCVDYYNGL